MSDVRGSLMGEIPERMDVQDDMEIDESEAPDTPSGSSRAGRLWQKVKDQWELVEFNALPEYLRDNEFIHRYYRPNWPMKQCLLSTFTLHNETINIWTHLVGFFIFLGLTIYTAMMVPKVVEMPSFPTRLPNMEDLQKVQSGLMTCFDSLPSLSDFYLPELVTNCLPASLSTVNRTEECILQTMKDDMTNFVAPLLLKPTTRWPFFIFLGGAMFCLLSSTICHLLSCHSEWAGYILLRVDYAGIASLIAASFYPPVYYSFMCDPTLRNMYLISITAMGVATVLVSLVPVFQTPEYRNIRTFLFFLMGISGIVPCVHKMLLHGHDPAALQTLSYELTMAAFYGLGAIVYVTRIPERWKPGLFDIAGHSHQLFHVLVVMGAFTHYKAGLLYLEWRDVHGCT